jgi:serine/threonine-protein kinase
MVRQRSGCDRDRLGGLLAGRLSQDEEAELNGHLGECDACRDALEALAAGCDWWADLPKLGDADGDTGPGRPAPEDLTLGFLEPTERPESLGRLGAYEVTGVLGRGGMGVVLRAFDPTLNRPVAIKVLAPELATSAAARRRFAREARAAAAVSHDHIVAIHAVAESVGGLPYLVMPYVAGRSLQERLDADGPLETREILRIGMQAAAGLAAAHAQGLVHRDIKPANILLENGVERVKITDFGLARAGDDASLSHSGVIAGTPQYMAPEQANGEPIDPRADLFSLGSVLYAMATGRSPFRAETNMAVLRRVCEDQPRPIREINPDIPDWLTAIVAKLHAKDPAGRFQTAAEVADLLGRCLVYLERPDGSAPPFPTSRGAGKPRRRWLLPAVAAAVLGLALAALGVAEAAGISPVLGLLATVLRIKTPEGTLVVEVDDPEVKVRVDDEDLVIEGAGPREIRLAVGKHFVVASKEGTPAQETRVTIEKDRKQTVVVRFEPEGTVARTAELPPVQEARPVPGEGAPPTPPRIGERAAAPAVPGTRIVVPNNLRPEPQKQAAPAAEVVVAGPEIPGAGPEELLRPVPLDERAPVPLWPGPAITFVAYAPDGKLLAMAENESRTIVLIDLPSRRIRGRLGGHSARVMELVFSPDGTKLAAATGHWGFSARSGEVWLWDVMKPDEPATAVVRGIPMVFTVAFSPDGKTLAYGGWDDVISLYDLAAGQVRASCRGHEEKVRSVKFSPDGKLLASGSADKTVRLWDPETGRPVGDPFPPLAGTVPTVAFSPDGRLLAAHIDHREEPAGALAEAAQVKVWEASSRRELASLRAHPTNSLRHLAFSPDGTTFATGAGVANQSGEVVLWDVATWAPRAKLGGFPSCVECVAYSPDGATLMAATTHKGVRSELRVWDLSPPIRPAGEFRIEGDAAHRIVWSVAFSPDGGRLAAGTGDWLHHGRLWLWDLASGRGRAEARPRLGIRSVAYAPDGRRLALGTFDGTVVFCDAQGEEQFAVQGQPTSIYAMAFSPDGKQLALAYRAGPAAIWDVESVIRALIPGIDRPATTPGTCVACDPRWQIRAPGLDGKEPWALAYSPDGTTLAVGLKEGDVVLLDVATREEKQRLKGHSLGVGGLAFSPDGSRLASGGWDRTIRIWDPARGVEVAALAGHEHAIKSVAFSRDGRWLASGDGAEDGSKRPSGLMIWDVARRKLRTTLHGHTGRIWSVAFSAEGTVLASGDEEGVIKLWNIAEMATVHP